MAKIDEARQRWGAANVLEGGGQASPNLDLTPWANRALTSNEEQLTGITAKHFQAFVEVARDNKCVIVVRQTKAACLSWIRSDFPAKPASIWKIKNSSQTGLVTCSAAHPKYSYQDQVEHAWAADHYVLEPADLLPPDGAKSAHFRLSDDHSVRNGTAREPGPLTGLPPCRPLRARRRGETLKYEFIAPHYEAGQVIEPGSLLPLTGDYDLMSAFPINNPTGKALVMVHDRDAPAEKLETVPGRGKLLKMRENPYVLKIAGMLNDRFGGRPRIMHGTHDLKFDPTENNEEGCAVFSPQQTFWIDSNQRVEAFFEAIGRMAVLPRPERG